MSARLRLQLLNHLSARRHRSRNLLSQGFTLIELMIVIVIVAILMAIALPNFLNQTSKAKISEAKTLSNAAAKEAQAAWTENGQDGLTEWEAEQSVGGTGSCPLETKTFTFDCDGSDPAAVKVTATGTPASGDLDTRTVITDLDASTGKICIYGSAPTLKADKATACP